MKHFRTFLSRLQKLIESTSIFFLLIRFQLPIIVQKWRNFHFLASSFQLLRKFRKLNKKASKVQNWRNPLKAENLLASTSCNFVQLPPPNTIASGFSTAFVFILPTLLLSVCRQYFHKNQRINIFEVATDFRLYRKILF